MNYVLFAKMYKSFQLKNITLNHTGKVEKITRKVGEFCQSGKVGTMGWHTLDPSGDANGMWGLQVLWTAKTFGIIPQTPLFGY